jgi:2-oxoglutarate ferredoxin oxidoreductase subunit delta
MIDFGREPIDRQNISLPRGQIYLIPERCKGCSICIQFCPLQVLRESSTSNDKGYHLPEIAPEKEGKCVGCQFCSLVCPEFAIFTKEIMV